MAIPTTGTDWGPGGYADLDNRLFWRGGLVMAAIRDYRGAATDMSPGNFSPFAADGKPRADLFAIKKVAGNWVPQTGSNQGWWNIGAMSDRNGPERRPNTRNDDYMILQSLQPFDSDLISESESVRFTGVETLKPFWMRLRNNLPLTDGSGVSVVEPVGEPNFVLSKPTETDLIERQLLLVSKRAKAGRTVYKAEGFPLVKLTDIGNSKKEKQNADAAELGWTVLPDPYSVGLDGNPALHHEWVAGDGWTAMLAGS